MNDGLDIPEVDFLETAAFAFLVFEGKSLQLLRANRCAEQWYELSGTKVLQDLFPRVNVARLQRKLRSGKSFKTAVESDGASSVPSVAQLEVLRFVKQGVELYAAFVVDVASVGERAAIYRSFATLAEADSKTQRRRLASFPEENPNPVLATDLRGEIVYTNPGMDLLVSQLNLNSARELLPSEHIEVVTGARGSGEAESSVGDRIFLWSYHRLAEQHEVHIYGREITAIRTAEQERSRALAELERGKRNQAIGQLAGGFAHDFNNLLAVIAGYTDLALEQPSEDEILRGHLEQVRVAAERGRSIVNQILAFARGERVQFEKVDAKAMLVEVLALLRGSLADEVSLISDLGDGSSDDFQVNGDMVKLEQVVMNLVNNAEHALPTQSGEIRVSLCREASYVVIRVSDNGRGMPPDVRERIFEPYFTTKKQGHGIGMMIVHRIMRDHDGEVGIDSKEGSGTIVTLKFPRKSARRKLLESPPPKSA